MTMIDALQIPGQKELLRDKLDNLSLTNEPQKDQPRVALANDIPVKNNQPIQTPKSHPFFVTLIIGNHLFYNFLIDLGASSSIMPKDLVDKLGLIYEPISRGVVQLDGTTVKSLGLVKDLGLTLHACPNFVIPQDMYIVDLPPYFSICLSRDFTTKLRGYIFANWSHLCFRTWYGTKVTIKSEPQATCHLEPYTPSPINEDLAIRDHEELPPIQDPDTPIQGIPDVNLDEWATQNIAEDPFINMDEIGLGVYMIHEEDVVIPKLEKEEIPLD